MLNLNKIMWKFKKHNDNFIKKLLIKLSNLDQENKILKNNLNELQLEIKNMKHQLNNEKLSINNISLNIEKVNTKNLIKCRNYLK